MRSPSKIFYSIVKGIAVYVAGFMFRWAKFYECFKHKLMDFFDICFTIFSERNQTPLVSRPDSLYPSFYNTVVNIGASTFTGPHRTNFSLSGYFII